MMKSAVRFAPWIGSRYEDGLRGVRILLVCESHYGGKQYERPTVTPEIIKALALGERNPCATASLKRHPHFAKIMTSAMNAKRCGSYTSAQKQLFWSSVAYYNFLQHFVRDSRVRPPKSAWVQGEMAFREVVAVLRPELIVCFSSRNGDRIRSLAGDVPVAVVNHPSSRFAYARVNPVITAHLELAMERKSPVSAFAVSGAFLRWRDVSTAALPAHGPHLPEVDKARVLAEWRRLMAEIDGCTLT